MPKAVLIGDIGTDHDGFHPSPVITSASTVYADDRLMARVGDSLAPHIKPLHPPHPRKIAAGSSTVFIDGKAAARTGDRVDCGGVLIGSSSVNIG